MISGSRRSLDVRERWSDLGRGAVSANAACREADDPKTRRRAMSEREDDQQDAGCGCDCDSGCCVDGQCGCTANCC